MAEKTKETLKRAGREAKDYDICIVIMANSNSDDIKTYTNAGNFWSINGLLREAIIESRDPFFGEE